MAKAILVCGKIASGKSVYAHTLCKRENAVLLSVDEITLKVLGGNLGEKHDEIAERTQRFLFEKSMQILAAGVNVVLDWGFWTKEKRSEARAFYEEQNIACEFHYIDVTDDVWLKNIETRNDAVCMGKEDAYLVDEGLLAKLSTVFEQPDKEEIDVWYINRWT